LYLWHRLTASLLSTINFWQDVWNYLIYIIIIPSLPEGGVGYTVLPLSICPSKICFVAFFSVTVVGKQEVGIWRVQKRYPQYGIPIWCLWPNIRFLPSTVTEKNATKNILDGRTDRRTEVKQYHIFRHIFLSNYWWQRSDIWSQASYRYPISWEAFFDPSDSYFLFAEERGYHKWALAFYYISFSI
jgi:hypothetical protein